MWRQQQRVERQTEKKTLTCLVFFGVKKIYKNCYFYGKKNFRGCNFISTIIFMIFFAVNVCVEK